MDNLSAVPVARDTIRDFYDLYYDILDDGRLAEWPALFTADCIYRVIPRENFARGLPLCTIMAESRGMLVDRVTGLTRTQVYMPRSYRRFPGPLRVVASDAGRAELRHNLLMVQTLTDKPTSIVLAGQCRDVLVTTPDGLKLAERVVVFDSEMLPNSLIYPA